MRYVAALFCVLGLVLCALLWQRSNDFSDTYVMPLPAPWSVRFHSFAGRQVVQFIPEYNALSKPLFPLLRVSWASESLTPGGAAELRSMTRDFRFQWNNQNYQVGFPSWFSVSVFAVLLLLSLFARRLRPRPKENPPEAPSESKSS
jgi:hypothetical protein